MPNIRIGKTVIETLTSGMYEDARVVYREYIQNAVDQIDKAVELGIIPNRNEGIIHISIDKNNKQIIIEDNATGINSENFSSSLTNIALSAKDRTKDKGFRGIGRLGGLGYCRKLIFESSFKGENVKNLMLWDAEKLQNKLIDSNIDMDAATVVNSVINFAKDNADENDHYFKVIMCDVKNDSLLDKNNIEEYLSMVAPVPFNSHFIFKNLIHEGLIANHLALDEYRIYINTEQLFKAYSTYLYDGAPPNNKKFDEIYDIETLTIKDKDEIIAWGWYGISKFEKQIPAVGNCARGLRLRKGNIQIGSENTLVKLHKEQRGNFYFIGEIHGFHSDLIPNSRRDYFNENKISNLLDKKLKDFFYTKLHSLYHDANKIKNAVKRIQNYKNIKNEYEKKQNLGTFSSKNQESQFIEDIEKARIEAIKKEKDLKRLEEKASSNPALNRVFNKIVDPKTITNFDEVVKTNNTNLKTKYRSQKLSKLSKKEEKIIRKVFEIIDLMLPDIKDRGEELKCKIEEEFK